MTSWTPCAALGPTGFDLDTAVLLSPDVLDWADGCGTSRATATPWRESLWRTGSGDHVVGLDSGGERSSGLDVDRWRWVSAVLAEDWLRRQGLDGAADTLFGPVSARRCATLTVELDPDRRVRLEQLCDDDDVSPAHVLQQALELYLDVRRDHRRATAPWWPPGVAGADPAPAIVEPAPAVGP